MSASLAGDDRVMSKEEQIMYALGNWMLELFVGLDVIIWVC